MRCYAHHQTLKIWFCSSPLLGALKTDLFFDVWGTECLWRHPPRPHDTAGTGAGTFQGTHQSLYLWGIRIRSNYRNNAEFMDCIKQLKELYNLTTQNLYRMNKYFIKHKKHKQHLAVCYIKIHKNKKVNLISTTAKGLYTKCFIKLSCISVV